MLVNTYKLTHFHWRYYLKVKGKAYFFVLSDFNRANTILDRVILMRITTHFLGGLFAVA
jgi:hypothetical protein